MAVGAVAAGVWGIPRAADPGRGGDPAVPAAPARATDPAARLCMPLGRRVLGRLGPGAAEVSGLVVSRRRPDLVWAHNDSGSAARLLALSRTGAARGAVAVTGASAFDWEDISAGPGGYLYVGDIGDNIRQRDEIVVYRVPEPSPSAAATAPAEAIRLRYPDGRRNAEALLVDPRDGAIHVIAKEAPWAGVYRARPPFTPGRVTTMQRVARLGVGLAGPPTGADVSAGGRVIVVRTYGAVLAWGRRPGEPLAAALRREPCLARADLLGWERQGEAIALLPSGRGFLTTSEGAGARITLFSASGGD